MRKRRAVSPPKIVMSLAIPIGKQLLKTSLAISTLLLSRLIVSANAEAAAGRDGAGAVTQEDSQAQKENLQSQNADEEFKFRYKRPKQRHDDDEAPVPKFNNKPSQPASSETKPTDGN